MNATEERATTSDQLTLTTRSIEQTMQVGEVLAALVRPGSVIGLIGPLGAGKTQFVRGLARGLNADERLVSSPTFVLMQEYAGRANLVHVDAYRIEDLSDLESAGWSDELWQDAVVAVEWADRLADELPEDHLIARLDHVDEAVREIAFEARGAWRAHLSGLAQALQDAGFEIDMPQVGGLRPAIETPCPTCRQPVAEDAESYPFCSRRCKMTDLGRWLDGDYRIARPLAWEDQED